eukprot:TRINITY_DN17542_c0_g1_i1.p1 TRINITY_DN17542_c0_g1~~TRINITY_DN17542_c0_g1_i1.p1  ORF type:complete len:769 (-),score=100.16 TRINITY_DN17542_c0_g1_i1:109-2145(-)
MRFVMSSHARQDPKACARNRECALTDAFMWAIEWLFWLKMESACPDVQREYLQKFETFLNEMRRPQVIMAWRGAPWWLLFERPDWADTFRYVVDELDRLHQADSMSAWFVPNETEDSEEQPDEEDPWLTGPKAALFFRSGLIEALTGSPRASMLPLKAHEVQGAAYVRAAFDAAFDKELPGSIVERFVRFGRALQPRLAPASPHVLWPASVGRASALPASTTYRLCDVQGPLPFVVHRRAKSSVEMHVLAADIVYADGGPQVELMWFASSSDQCVMVATPGGDDHAGGYYSFALTLPSAHLVHFDCEVCAVGGQCANTGGSATNSFTGFTSVTACRIPASFVSRFGDTEFLPPLSLRLTQHVRDGWNPDPFYFCPVPVVSRRYISACSTTLHSAQRVHEKTPHALEDWINYHLLLGIEHFTIFDNDGSFEPYVQDFVERGIVSYKPFWPWSMSRKLGVLASNVTSGDLRPMIAEPHALDSCVWANRHVSDWVVVVHSFEEYLHSPSFSEIADKSWHDDRHFNADGPLRRLVQKWTSAQHDVAAFQLFQQPMGGPRVLGARSVLSTWLRANGGSHGDRDQDRRADESHRWENPFAWLVDPLNVLQTAVHYAQPRADGQAIVTVPSNVLRVHHYVDLGSGRNRCEELRGGCDVFDDGLLWAEDAVLQLRRSNRVRSAEAA